MSDPVVSLGADDFRAMLQNLLPQGPAWPRETDSVQSRILAGAADGLARVHALAALLTEVEADPRLTTLLLPEWERAYGLPDPCTPLSPSLPQRRAALLARIAAQGGASPAYFVSVAAALGFAITITEFPVFDTDSDVEAAINDEDWAFAWQVNGAGVTLQEIDVEEWTVEDPLTTWGNNTLTCTLRQIAPAHTILIFSFT